MPWRAIEIQREGNRAVRADGRVITGPRKKSSLPPADSRVVQHNIDMLIDPRLRSERDSNTTFGGRGVINAIIDLRTGRIERFHSGGTSSASLGSLLKGGNRALVTLSTNRAEANESRSARKVPRPTQIPLIDKITLEEPGRRTVPAESLTAVARAVKEYNEHQKLKALLGSFV